MLPPPVRNIVQKIREDNFHGASAITEMVIQAYRVLAQTDGIRSVSHLKMYAMQLGKEVVQAQPTMGSVFNFANEVALEIENSTDYRTVVEIIRKICGRNERRMSTDALTIAKLGSGLIENDTIVGTISYSSLVAKALLDAKASGKEFEVLCTESRPAGEGIALAKILGEAGIRVTLMVDAAIFSMLPRIQMIFVGADAISHRGLVNKIGTLGLCVTAKSAGIECYALCATDKVLPADYYPTIQIRKNAEEISSSVNHNVEILNYYFDITPLDYFNGLITEAGIYSPKDFRIPYADFKIHPHLHESDPIES